MPMQHDKAETTPVQQMRRKRSNSTKWSRRKQRRGFDNSGSANSMVSRVSFQDLTTSSAQRGAAEATDSDAATSLARRVGRRGCGAKAAVRRDELGGASMQSSTATLPGKLLRHSWDLVIVGLFSSPTLFIAGIHFPLVLLYNQGYPKVCPDPLNLSNAGDSFAGISSLTSSYLFSRTRDLIAMF
jgi:hypothetical protein